MSVADVLNRLREQHNSPGSRMQTLQTTWPKVSNSRFRKPQSILCELNNLSFKIIFFRHLTSLQILPFAFLRLQKIDKLHFSNKIEKDFCLICLNFLFFYLEHFHIENASSEGN